MGILRLRSFRENGTIMLEDSAQDLDNRLLIVLGAHRSSFFFRWLQSSSCCSRFRGFLFFLQPSFLRRRGGLQYLDSVYWNRRFYLQIKLDQGFKQDPLFCEYLSSSLSFDKRSAVFEMLFGCQ